MDGCRNRALCLWDAYADVKWAGIMRGKYSSYLRTANYCQRGLLFCLDRDTAGTRTPPGQDPNYWDCPGHSGTVGNYVSPCCSIVLGCVEQSVTNSPQCPHRHGSLTMQQCCSKLPFISNLSKCFVWAIQWRRFSFFWAIRAWLKLPVVTEPWYYTESYVFLVSLARPWEQKLFLVGSS